MPKEYWEAIDKAAEQRDLSSNQIIRHLIRDNILKKKNKSGGGGN